MMPVCVPCLGAGGSAVRGGLLQEAKPKLPPEGSVGICQLAKEKGVGSGPPLYELCHFLPLTQTLPSILRGEQWAYLRATSKVL